MFLLPPKAAVLKLIEKASGVSADLALINPPPRVLLTVDDRGAAAFRRGCSECRAFSARGLPLEKADLSIKVGLVRDSGESGHVRLGVVLRAFSACYISATRIGCQQQKTQYQYQMAKHRIYMSNIAPGWSFDRQARLLDQVLPGWIGGSIFRDEMTVRQRRRHIPSELTARTEALRPTTRKEPSHLYVAVLPVIAWGAADFCGVLEQLQVANCILVALDTGTMIDPRTGDLDRDALIAEFKMRRRLGSEEASRRLGAQISAERRKAVAMDKAELIRDRWKLPTNQHGTRDLLREVGLSMNTAKLYLGPRPIAQREYEALMKRRRNAEAAKAGAVE